MSGKTCYIVQSWCYKGENVLDNDEVEILGLFKDIGNAYDFMNNRFRFYLLEKHRTFTRNIFPKKSLKKQKEKLLDLIFQTKLVSEKIIGYLYDNLENALPFCEPIKGKEYNSDKIIRLDLDLSRAYLQLMAFQKWVSNQTDGAWFDDYADIPLIINEEFKGLARKVSTNACRIYIYGIGGEQLFETLYLGDNLIDLEDCMNRERHFCSSYRIHTKIIRD